MIKVRMLDTGDVYEFENSYAMRLIEQGKAVIESGDTPPTPQPEPVDVDKLAEQVDQLQDRLDGVETELAGLAAREFDENTAYEAGELVVYEGELYRFTEDHAAGAWTGEDAERAEIGIDVRELRAKVDAVVGLNGVGLTAGAEWTQGGIDSDGANSAATNRIRFPDQTEDAVRITGLSKVRVTIAAEYQFGIYFYDGEHDFVSRTEDLVESQDVDVPDGAEYVRFTLYANPDGEDEVDPSEGSNLSAAGLYPITYEIERNNITIDGTTLVLP